jgi:hypothetical protein
MKKYITDKCVNEIELINSKFDLTFDKLKQDINEKQVASKEEIKNIALNRIQMIEFDMSQINATLKFEY